MYRSLALVFLVLLSVGLFAGESPYPIIFVHGLDSSNETWEETINELDLCFDETFYIDENDQNVPENVFNAVLNAHGDMTRITGTNDALEIGSTDDDVLVHFPNESNTLADGNLFAINFKNYWNPENGNLIRGSGDSPDGEESDSNESSVYKQGYALSVCIDSVLSATGADKVILIGHSMGGLAIREYLQRITDENSNGVIDPDETTRTWWIDQSEDGHKVARVVTIGTPHLGSNSGALEWRTVNLFSEAVRDLRYDYGGDYQGVFLFGGDEESLDYWTSYHNSDVNCNGNEEDIIIGLNSGTEGTTDNLSMPLPNNINYSWIVSVQWPLGSDGIVDDTRQWLYNEQGEPVPEGITDKYMTDYLHTNEPEDFNTIVRGLDEPEDSALAYTVSANQWFSGFFTMPPADTGSLMDKDWYRLTLENDSEVSVYTVIDHIPDQSTIIRIRDANQQQVTSCWYPDIPTTNLTAGTYYIEFVRINTDPNDPVPYEFYIEVIENNSSNLVAYYPFNGNANDESGNGNDGTVYGATLTTDRFGNPDSAYEFDGVDDYIIVEHDFACAEVTLSAWIQTSSLNQNCPFLNKTLDYYDTWGLYEDDLQIGLSDDIDDANEVYYLTPITSDWIHVVANLTNDLENLLFVNGILVGSGDFSSASWDSFIGNIFIGQRGTSNWNHWYNGHIDDVRIYNRVLTETEIQNLYQSESPAPNAIVAPLSITETLQPDATSQQSIYITNAGNVNLTYTATEGDRVPWLSLSNNSGAVAPNGTETVGVDFDTTGLPEGNYWTDIQIITNDPDQGTITIPVTLDVAQVIAAPDSPENVQINHAGGNLYITWNDNGADSYKIYASDNPRFPQQTEVTDQGTFGTAGTVIYWTCPIPDEHIRFYCVTAVNEFSTILSDDWESGEINTEIWSIINECNGTPAITDQHVHSGSYALEMIDHTGYDQPQMQNSNALNLVEGSFECWFMDNYNHTSGSCSILFKNTSTPNQSCNEENFLLSLWIVHSNGSYRVKIDTYDLDPVQVAEINLHEWHKINVYFNVANQECQLRIDDEVVFSGLTHSNFTGTVDHVEFNASSNWTNGPEYYVDDINIFQY